MRMRYDIYSFEIMILVALSLWSIRLLRRSIALPLLGILMTSYAQHSIMSVPVFRNQCEVLNLGLVKSLTK